MEKSKWFLYDADGKNLGRFASLIAFKLMGKDLVTFMSNKAADVKIIIINSSKLRVTGNKMQEKNYYKHSGYPGGFKVFKMCDLFKKNPNVVLFKAIKGMLPKNKLQKIYLSNLKIYSDYNHLHVAQKNILILE